MDLRSIGQFAKIFVDTPRAAEAQYARLPFGNIHDAPGAETAANKLFLDRSAEPQYARLVFDKFPVSAQPSAPQQTLAEMMHTAVTNLRAAPDARPPVAGGSQAITGAATHALDASDVPQYAKLLS